MVKGLSSTLTNLDSQSFIGRRQQHFNFSAQALLDFEPLNDGEEAGLCIMCKDTCHYEIAVIKQEGIKKIVFRKRVEDISAEVYEDIASQGPII